MKDHDAFPINAVLIANFISWNRQIDVLSLPTTRVQFGWCIISADAR
jgi:hypothetical protein